MEIEGKTLGKRKFENTEAPKDPNETPDTLVVNPKKVKIDNDTNQIQDGFNSKLVVMKRVPNEIQLEILSFVPPIPTFDELIEKKDLQMVCSFLENNKRNPDMYPINFEKMEETLHDLVDDIILNGLDYFYDVRLDILRQLLRHPKINAKSVSQDDDDPFDDHYKYTILHKAVFEESINLVEVILEERGEELINVFTGEVLIGKRSGRQTALHLTVNPAIVELLIQVPNVNPNLTDANGNTPLHLFSQRLDNYTGRTYIGDKLIPQLLKHSNVDISIRNNNDKLAIDLVPTEQRDRYSGSYYFSGDQEYKPLNIRETIQQYEKKSPALRDSGI